MAEIDKWSIDKLDSSNWMTWKFRDQEISEGVLYYGNVSKFVTTLPHHLV